MSDQPSKTLTFLFTDIEGSTKLWERNPEIMQEMVKQHDNLVQKNIEAHYGHVFKTVGDAFCAAFSNPTDALNAALAVQQALHEEEWSSEIGDIRVRIALHTGTAYERDGDYFGPSLNRIARLTSIGYGGQILLSLATQELVRDSLPLNASLHDMGQHHLKDLYRPEQVYQVVVPHLPSQFPALKSLDVQLTNLPTQPTPLIGREHEVKTLLELLRQDTVRLLTLIGPGGTGKTRLSLQIAAELLEEYTDGVYFVALTTITDPVLVMPAIAEALGVKEAIGQPIEDTLKNYLRNRHLLLVLDNFEQLVDAASIISNLLNQASYLKIVVTSREVLHLYGEHHYLVPPLSVPDMTSIQTPETLSQYDSVSLFIQHAKVTHPSFEITNENAPAVAEICVRLDGLPLAIELAAARIRLLTPQAILERLDNRLKLLVSSMRNLPARQQTLRGAIDWSYELLTEDEKRLFRWLGIFSGSWSLESAEFVCQDDELSEDMLIQLESLLNKSLIRYYDGKVDRPRFTMLESIHEYAQEKLKQSDESDLIHRRYLDYMLSFAEQASVEFAGTDDILWNRRVFAESDNLRVVMHQLLANNNLEILVQLISKIWFYWNSFGWVDEMYSLLTTALNHNLSPSLYATGLRLQGVFTRDSIEKKKCWAESLLICRKLGDEVGMSRCLNNLAVLARSEGHYELADPLFLESLELAEKLEQKFLSLVTLLNLAFNRLFQHDFDGTQTYLNRHAELAQEIGGTAVLIENKRVRGYAALRQGDYSLARKFLQEALENAQQLQDVQLLARCQVHLGYLNLREGYFREAHHLMKEGLHTLFRSGVMEGVQLALRGLAALCIMQNMPEQSAQLFGVSEKLREQLQMVLPPVELSEYEEYVASIQVKLSPEEFNTYWTIGRAMMVDEAVQYAQVLPID